MANGGRGNWSSCGAICKRWGAIISNLSHIIEAKSMAQISCVSIWEDRHNYQ